ncbi:hypothetical protein ACFQ1S_30295 [Kibdelosporangium lantanae]|uniref:Uncharacterized protein n=1 Tax=Kibdelosporangium lantanae TaxID=1497396 RepID=A0ABW3MHG4_9PSEU
MALVAGLVAVFSGRHHAWFAYRIAVGRLGHARLLPHDLMSFWDDAHRLGLLRAVGAAYEFRHNALRIHLAEQYVRGSSPYRPTRTFLRPQKDDTAWRTDLSAVLTSERSTMGRKDDAPIEPDPTPGAGPLDPTLRGGD